MKRTLRDYFSVTAPSKRQKDGEEASIIDNQTTSKGVPEGQDTDEIDCSNASAKTSEFCDTSTSTSTASTSTNKETSSEMSSTQTTGEKRYGPWGSEDCRQITKELFGSKIVHSCFTCKESDCTNLSREEAKTKKFKHAWLNSINWWLCYVETEGMYCLVCKKHQMKHPQNQRDIFAASPSVRYKIDAIHTHVNSLLHSAAVESEMIQQVSVFHQEVTKKKEVETSVLEGVFSSAYFLMKEFIANRKLVPLLNLIEKTFEVDTLKFFQHRSARSQYEIFTMLGETTKEEMLKTVRESKTFGLLTDEVADISVQENLVTFIQYYSRETDDVSTSFLSCQNILSNFAAANAESIATLLIEEIQNDSLEIARLTGFTSDGASVMVGKKSGVASRLRNENPTLINVHCICHRLALSCTDSNESIKYIQNIETLLRQLWQLFENSPKKMATYLKVQKEMKSIKMGEKATKLVGKRLKKACRTRWLSFESSVLAVHEEFETILQTLNILEKENSDAAACGLLKNMKSLKFIGTIYILKDILPILADLSRHFQAGSLNFSTISPSVRMAKDKLNGLVSEDKPLQSLRSDIESFTRMCAEITWSKKDSDEISRLFVNYVNALVANIDRRFEDGNEVLSSLSVFDPLLVPKSDEIGFKEYGKKQVRILAEHFYQNDEEEVRNNKAEKLLTEWQGMKYHINDVLKQHLPEEIKAGSAKVTATDWLLKQLLRNPTLNTFFPGLLYIAEVALSLPVSNAWPERGASALKNIKTKQRNRLSVKMLESILHVTINEPSPNSRESESVVRKAVKRWVSAKNRRNLPSRPLKPPTSKAECVQVEVEDAGIQTDPLLTEHQEIEINETLQEVRHAMKVMHLELENEDGESDTDSEYDSDAIMDFE